MKRLATASRAFCAALALYAAWLAVSPTPVQTQSVDIVHQQLHAITAQPDVTAVQSGNWSSPATWGGAVPAERARVAIPEDLTVTVDGEIPTASDWIRVDGTLRFRPDVNTRLIAETIVVMGHLEIGTDAEPIQARARIVIRSLGKAISHDADPLELTRGLIAMSPVSIVGLPKKEISALVGLPGKGATGVTLEADPAGWQAGDEMLVAPTLWGQDEVVSVDTIVGHAVTFKQALKFTRTNAPADPKVRVHVGNLTRNVIIQTDPGQAGNPALQGHVMLMGGGHRVRYAAFLDLGRTLLTPVTDPLILPDGTRDPSLMPLCGVTEENIRGRYALHFHNPGPGSDPSLVEGAVIRVQRSKKIKIGIQNHSAYVIARRNIVHQVDGSGLFAEEGDERGEFTGNMVVHSEGSELPKSPQPNNEVCQRLNYNEIWHRRRVDIGHRGAGIWLQGAGNVVVSGNIIAGHAHAGIDHKAQGLNARKNNTYAVLVRPAHLRDGSLWVHLRLGAFDDAIALLSVSLPPLRITDNQVYAIGNANRNGDKSAFVSDSMGLQMAKWPQRPKNLIARFLAWNVGKCISVEYSDWGRLEDVTCIGGFQYPKSRQANYPSVHSGIQTRAQNGRYWQYERVRIEGFGAGYEFIPSDGSTFHDVTINGQPYVPTIEACGDNVDNDGDGEIDEGCL